jgi:hypothetical protein
MPGALMDPLVPGHLSASAWACSGMAVSVICYARCGAKHAAASLTRVLSKEDGNMNPWLFPWWGFFKGPLSGDVTQDIDPITTWLSPQFEFNFSGNRRIEAEVIAEVASYGKQLGIISEALLELADGKKGGAIERLKALTEDIEKVKHRHEERLEQQVKADIDRLKKLDPDALKRLLDEYR